jgi:hypothetical protein
VGGEFLIGRNRYLNPPSVSKAFGAKKALIVPFCGGPPGCGVTPKDAEAADYLSIPRYWTVRKQTALPKGG